MRRMQDPYHLAEAGWQNSLTSKACYSSGVPVRIHQVILLEHVNRSAVFCPLSATSISEEISGCSGTIHDILLWFFGHPDFA